MDSKQPICVYCGERQKETDDHVPPKSFYPKPRPSDLITVPACLQCNQDAGKDEEFFLATFMFSEAGITNAGSLLWSEKLHRMYEKNLGLKRKIADQLERSDLMTPAGIFLGRKMTIKTDEVRFERVVNKVVKGLYYFEYNEPIPASAKIMTLYLRDPERLDAAKKVVHELKPGSKKWPGIFEYKYNRLAKSKSESIWLLLFWDYAAFWSFSYKEGKLQSIIAKANVVSHMDNNQMIRFSRQPSEQTFREIGTGGKLSFLSSPIYPNQNHFSNLAEIDYQFREKDTITMYCGKTAILNIKPDWNSNQLIFSAHNTYSKQNCFPKNCPAINNTAEKVVRNYVNQVSVNKQLWGGEGIVQSAWIERYSRKFQYSDPCFIFDREGVLGFKSTEERDKFIESCKKILNAAMTEIEIKSKGWATYEDGFPTEIDFVGASSSGDSIFIIEAKQFDSSSHKLYYSPIQVSSYAIAWSKATKIFSFLDTVNELIKAKKKASLIPDYCPEIKPNPAITPVLLLPVDHMSEEVKRRLNIVLDTCNKYLPQGISEIAVWDCESTESCQTDTYQDA